MRILRNAVVNDLLLRGAPMARARKAPVAKEQTQASELTCPECGRTFTRAAALGAHRRQAHGVAGSSRAAAVKGGNRRASRSSGRRSSATSIAASTGSDARSSSDASRSSPRNGRRRSAGGKTRASASGGVNRDSLLQALFPSGIPAREEVIRAVNSWLDEAERLAKLG